MPAVSTADSHPLGLWPNEPGSSGRNQVIVGAAELLPTEASEEAARSLLTVASGALMTLLLTSYCQSAKVANLLFSMVGHGGGVAGMNEWTEVEQRQTTAV